MSQRSTKIRRGRGTRPDDDATDQDPRQLAPAAADPSARQPAPETLGRPEEILAVVHDAVISSDLDGIVTSWNPAAQRIFGYPPEAAIGRSATFLLFPEDWHLLEEAVLAPTRRSGRHEVVLRCRKANGEEIFVVLRVVLSRDRDGQPVGFVGCSNDITDRLRVEQALGRQQADLQVILDAVPALIWYKDCDNQILRVNRRAAESMGLPASAIEGRPTHDLYPGEAAQYYQDDLEVIRSNRAKLGIVEPMVTGSGEKRWVRTDKIPYHDARGTVVGVIVFAVDITERVDAEAALRLARDGLEQRIEERTAQLATALETLRAETAERQRVEERLHHQQSQLAHLQRLRTVESMAAQLAHEINQPLGAIVNFAGGLARWLRSGSVDMDAAQRATEEISQQALRAAGVVRRLRDFVRKDDPKRERCALAQLVGEAVQMVEADARRQGVALRLAVDAHLPAMEIDRIQIEQVVVNLLTNALEAMADPSPATREILVEAVACDDGTAEVRVHDSGAGLPACEVGRLFEPFFTTKAEGLGMGLAISQSIVAAHGGRLWAEGRPQGGATFAFTLPAFPHVPPA